MKTKTLFTILFLLVANLSIIAQPSTTKENTKCKSGDCENGWGYKTFGHGYYEGFWKNGERHGYGMFKWTDSGKYIGFWEYDKMKGYGVYLGDNMDMVGEYKNGFIQGLGYIYEDKKFEYGIYDLSQLTEKYDFYTTNNTTGCVAGDCQNKYGRYKWNNGDSFTGFFKNGKMLMGAYKFSSGDEYRGMFNNDNQFHGQGRFFFSDDAYYGGEWKNGNHHGRGYYHDKNLDKKIGVWTNGNLTEKMN